MAQSDTLHGTCDKFSYHIEVFDDDYQTLAPNETTLRIAQATETAASILLRQEIATQTKSRSSGGCP